MLCENGIYVFCREKQALFDEKSFGQHLLTKVLPKNGFSHKIPLKMTQFRGGDKLMGGFAFWGLVVPYLGEMELKVSFQLPPNRFIIYYMYHL